MASKILWRKCKQIAPVYETTDYDMFKEMPFNRDVTERRVAKLVASFSEKEILNPIVVNEYCEIVDGQGRYEALKKMGRPIKFVVAYGADINDCRRMNIYNTNWSWGDYINSYAKAGNPNYIRMQSCTEKSGLSYRMVLSLAGKSDGGGGEWSTNYRLPNGLLEFTEENVEQVLQFVNMFKDIKAALSVPKLNETLMKALKVAFLTDGYDHKRMIKKCEYCRSNFRQMIGLEDMLIELSRVYNFKVLKDHLYFEDYMRNKGYNVYSYPRDARNQFNDITPSVKTLFPRGEE